jgi:hypothetical protein
MGQRARFERGIFSRLAVWLAGVGGFEILAAGKPDRYRIEAVWRLSK